MAESTKKGLTNLQLLEYLGELSKEGINKVDQRVTALSTRFDTFASNVPTQSAVDASINAAIAAVNHLKRKKVDSVGEIDVTAADADQYIYMVPKTGGKNGDKYNEFMVLDGEVEPVGDWAVDLSGYVEKVDGKGLSTEDFTTELKSKLDGIAEGATKVEASETEGSIKVNGADIAVVTLATFEEGKAALDAIFGVTEAE